MRRSLAPSGKPGRRKDQVDQWQHNSPGNRAVRKLREATTWLERTGYQDKSEPPGGKVLQRLILFNEARAVEAEEEIVPKEVLAAARAARPSARAKTRDAAPTLAPAEMATLYMETAIALKQ